VAKVVQVPADEILREVGLTVLGGPSIKASLDLDWDDPTERQRGLDRLVSEAEALQKWVLARAGEAAEKPPLDQALADLERVVGQDLEPDPNGGGKRIARGSGTTVQDVNRLLKQIDDMSKMMKNMTRGGRSRMMANFKNTPGFN
jgi:hypothetical protein